jgi:sporulation protein YqfC
MKTKSERLFNPGQKTLSATLLLVFLLLSSVSGCAKTPEPHSLPPKTFSAYRDIPEITDLEIAALERLRNQYEYFIYGMPLSTEAFIKIDGEIGGYSVLFAEWLTELLDIPIRVVNCEWIDTIDAFETDAIDFNGSMIATEERRATFFQTDAIAQRTMVYFRLAGSRPVTELLAEHRVRIGVLDNTASADMVLSLLEPGSFEVVMIEDFRQIVLFSEDNVAVEVGRGLIELQGKGLVLAEISQDEIEIKGEIHNIAFRKA